MKQYYVNSNPDKTGFHLVHKEGCLDLPYPLYREVLGIHVSCVQAVAEAKRLYPKSNGCPVCSEFCNKEKINIVHVVDGLIKKATRLK